MTNIPTHLKKFLSYLFLSICALCIQGCDYTQLADEELVNKLKEIESEKKKIEEAQGGKVLIRKTIEDLITKNDLDKHYDAKHRLECISC